MHESFDLVPTVLSRPFGSWTKKELEILLFTELLKKEVITIHDDHFEVARKLGVSASSYGRLKSEYLAQLPITNPEVYESISKEMLIKALGAVAVLLDGENLVLTGADKAQRDVLISNAHRFKLPMEVRGTSIRTTLGALLYLAKEVEDSTVAGIDWMRLAKGVDLKKLEKNLPRAIRQAKESIPEILSVGANVAQLLAFFSS